PQRKELLPDVGGKPWLEFLPEPGHDGLHLCLRLFERDARLQPADEVEVLAAPDTARYLPHRGPHLHWRKPPERGRHHPDDRGRPAVECDGASHDAWVAPEAPHPVTLAQDGDTGAAHLVLFREEIPAERRPHAQRGEEVLRN